MLTLAVFFIGFQLEATVTKDATGVRVNVRLPEREYNKVRVVADELFDGNEHEALRFAVRSLHLIPRGTSVEVGSVQSTELIMA